MSRVIYSMMVSLDGFVARPNGDLDWADVDEELHTFANQQERETGTILYGRRLYELMASYWPTAESNPSTLLSRSSMLASGETSPRSSSRRRSNRSHGMRR